jgi:hypothetical protein
MFTFFTQFQIFYFFQMPSLDLSTLVLIYVALLKNIFKLTLHYSTHRILCMKCIFYTSDDDFCRYIVLNCPQHTTPLME